MVWAVPVFFVNITIITKKTGPLPIGHENTSVALVLATGLRETEDLYASSQGNNPVAILNIHILAHLNTTCSTSQTCIINDFFSILRNRSWDFNSYMHRTGAKYSVFSRYRKDTIILRLQCKCLILRYGFDEIWFKYKAHQCVPEQYYDSVSFSHW